MRVVEHLTINWQMLSLLSNVLLSTLKRMWILKNQSPWFEFARSRSLFGVIWWDRYQMKAVFLYFFVLQTVLVVFTTKQHIFYKVWPTLLSQNNKIKVDTVRILSTKAMYFRINQDITKSVDGIIRFVVFLKTKVATRTSHKVWNESVTSGCRK